MAASRSRRSTTRTRSASSRRAGKLRGSPWFRWAIGAGIVLVALLGTWVALALSGRFDNLIQEVTLPLRHDDIIRQQAADKGVDASLIAAVIYSESRFRDQTSSAGARGLMQITRETASHIETQSGGTTFSFEDLADPDINIRYGTYYLHELLARYDDNEVAALAAYNAGPGNVDDWGGASLGVDDIKFPETRAYVEDVMQKKGEYRARYGKELGY